MKLLLDTHVMLWWALGNSLLKPAARTMIADADNSSSVSMASVWEVAIKHRTARPSTIPVDAEQFADLVAEAGFSLLPIAVRHVVEIERLPAVHGDPFDRLLVAQTAVDGYRLLTHDSALAAYGDHVMVI